MSVKRRSIARRFGGLDLRRSFFLIHHQQFSPQMRFGRKKRMGGDWRCVLALGDDIIHP
jgi:hypothetical protein